MNLINIPCSVHFDVTVALNSDPLQPEHPDLILKQIKAQRGFWGSCRNTINADPFLFVHDGKIFLFYEEMGLIYTHGKIRMISSADLEHWSEPVDVLPEPWHLSYPFVFEAEGNIWMIPECYRSGGVRLYSAEDDSLRHWKFERFLLRGERLVDSSVCFRKGVYYMHCCSMENGKNILRLFTAEHPAGPWQEHPCSPVAESRNGGSLFEHEGKLWRFAQRSDIHYGDGLDLFEISQMTPDKYEECLVRDHFLRKGHHYNVVQFQSKTVTARSHAFLSFMVLEFCRRLRHVLS